jgi:hypothetical protein
MDGSRIESGEAIEHRDRTFIGHRDEVDPEWHRAMREMKEQEVIKFTPPAHWLDDEDEEDSPESTSETDPELTQTGCLSPVRLGQHEEKAQPVCDKDPEIEESDPRGKQVGNDQDCTAVQELSTQVAAPKDLTSDSLQAIIEFDRQTVQMFFSPKSAIADFKKKVSDLWNFPVKMYCLLINGVHESISIKNWPTCSIIRVKIGGSGGNPDGVKEIRRSEENPQKGWKWPTFKPAPPVKRELVSLGEGRPDGIRTVEERIEMRHETGRFRFKKWRRFVNQELSPSPLVLIEEEEEEEIQDSGLLNEEEPPEKPLESLEELDMREERTKDGLDCTMKEGPGLQRDEDTGLAAIQWFTADLIPRPILATRKLQLPRLSEPDFFFFDEDIELV